MSTDKEELLAYQANSPEFMKWIHTEFDNEHYPLRVDLSLHEDSSFIPPIYCIIEELDKNSVSLIFVNFENLLKGSSIFFHPSVKSIDIHVNDG